MLLGTLGASLLRNLLTGKGARATSQGRGAIRAGQGQSGPGFLIPPHPLTNFEIQMYYQNKPKFNGVYVRNKLLKIKYGAYVINLDEFKSIGFHQIALYVNDNNETCFDSFGVEHIPKEIIKFIRYKNVKTKIYRIQTYDLIM